MTTTTREQALTPAELRELCAQLSEDGQAMLHRAVPDRRWWRRLLFWILRLGKPMREQTMRISAVEKGD